MAIVAGFMASKPREEILDIFEKADVTVGPVMDIDDFMVHPYVLDREIIQNMPMGERGRIPMHHVVPRFSNTPGGMKTPAPEIGEHNETILGSLGYNLNELQRKGII